MTLYEPNWDLRRARQAYFDVNGFGDDGGYSAKWVKLKFGPFSVSFPNTQARIRAVRFHDLHHVATEYPTDLEGEAEIGAWEVASSCAHHWAAWGLNLLAMSYGLWMCPRRLFRAFVRGRHSQNLYRREYEDVRLSQTVGELRADLQLAADSPAGSGADIAAFAGWGAVAAGLGLSLLAVGLLPLAVLCRILTQ